MERYRLDTYSQWLTLDQVKVLLETGEVEIVSAIGTKLKLYINFVDRVAAKEVLTNNYKL